MPDYIRKLNKFLETKCPIKCIPIDPLGSMKIAIKAIDALLGGKEDA